MSAVFNGAASLQATYQPFTSDAATFLACYWVKPTAATAATHANFTADSSRYLILGHDASYHVTLQGRHTGTPVQIVSTAAMTGNAWNLVTIWLDPASHAVTIWVNSTAGENLTLSTSDNIFAYVTTVRLGAFAGTLGALTGSLSRFCLWSGKAKPSDATVASVRGATDPETAFGTAIARWNLASSGADSAAGNRPLGAGVGTVTWSADDPIAFSGAMAGSSAMSGTLTSARVLHGTMAGTSDFSGAISKVTPSSEALALTIEDDGSHRVITSSVSVAGSPVTLATDGAQADDEKAFVALGWIDLAAGKLWQQIDGGTPTSTDLGGYPDPQNGLLMLGAGVGSDGAVVSQDTTLAVLAAAAKSRAFTDDDRDAMHAVAASVLAPVPKAANPSISGGTSTAIDVSGYADDPSGYGWTVTAISIPNPQCPLTITDDQEVTGDPAIAQGDVPVQLELTSLFPNLVCVAHLPMTITVGQVTTYPNGYTHLVALPISDGAIEGAGALTNLIAVAKVSDPTLKSAANGGIVQSDTGKDIRVEKDGTKIPHVILRNGANDGEWHLAYLRSSAQKADGVLPLAYFGKTGVSDTEEDPTGLFVSEAFRFNLSIGDDLTGNQETGLTLANITTAAGPYGLAGLAGTSPSASLAATLAGAATHVTFSIWMNLADVAADSSLFSLGDTTSFDSAGLIVWADVVAAHSQNTLTISAEVQSGAAHARFEGTSGVIKAGVWQMVSIDYLDGAVVGVQVDDQVLANSDPANATMGSGLTSASPAKAFTGFAAAMRGKLAYWRADTRAGALPAAHKTTEWRNGRYLDAFHGQAALESPGNTRRLIAMPVWASTTTGTTITLDPVAIAVGTGTLQLLSVGTPTDGTAALSAGKISFTAPTTAQTVTLSYVLTDGSRSVTGQCVVVVAGAVPVTSSTKPWDNLYYGNPTMGVTVAPSQIKVGNGIYNFLTYTAKRTGTITGLRTIIRADTHSTNTGTNGAVSPGAYSKGTGGTITLKICSPATDGRPGTVLAQSALNNGQTHFCDGTGKQTGSWGFYDFWPTSPGVPVVAGQKLIFWFENTATDDGWVSIDTMIEYANVPTGLTPPQHAGPYFGDEIQCHARYPYGSGPDARSNMGGLMIVHYSDGINDGNPWYFAKSEGRKSVGGAKMVRQRFTVSDYTRVVSGLWFRCWWPDVNNGHVTPGTLIVKLKDSAGALIEANTLLGSEFVATSNYASTDPYAPWNKIIFGAAHTLSLGATYYVEFSAPSGNCEFAPQQLYASDTCRNSPTGNWAQWSTNSGSTWTDWGRTDQAGVYDHSWHLSCAFIVSG